MPISQACAVRWWTPRFLPADVTPRSSADSRDAGNLARICSSRNLVDLPGLPLGLDFASGRGWASAADAGGSGGNASGSRHRSPGSSPRCWLCHRVCSRAALAHWRVSVVALEDIEARSPCRQGDSRPDSQHRGCAGSAWMATLRSAPCCSDSGGWLYRGGARPTSTGSLPRAGAASSASREPSPATNSPCYTCGTSATSPARPFLMPSEPALGLANPQKNRPSYSDRAGHDCHPKPSVWRFRSGYRSIARGFKPLAYRGHGSQIVVARWSLSQGAMGRGRFLGFAGVFGDVRLACGTLVSSEKKKRRHA